MINELKELVNETYTIIFESESSDSILNLNRKNLTIKFCLFFGFSSGLLLNIIASILTILFNYKINLATYFYFVFFSFITYVYLNGLRLHKKYRTQNKLLAEGKKC